MPFNLKGILTGMLAKVISATLSGIEGVPVDVEVDISNGLPSFTIVGLPDQSVQESRERIRSAIKNSDLNFPVKRITVNLAPADIKKEGPAFDLPIAIGILIASEALAPKMEEPFLIVGELSLDGTIRPVNGIISIAIMARDLKIPVMFVPYENSSEAALIPGIKVYGIKNLTDLVQFLNGAISLSPSEPARSIKINEFSGDFNEVKGQESAKRALEIAAAGFHNVIMVGPPGSGKTMLAQRLPTILPPLTEEEALEVTRIYSSAGLLPKGGGIIEERPFRSPHHSISLAGMVGGTSNPKPGEISLAHNGVLFLDEFPEFRRDVLEALRQPMEDGSLVISRAHGSIRFPARFMLVASMNPCPCGYLGDTKKNCTCTQYQIEKYFSKISGPILDRIDIQIEVPRLETDTLIRNTPGEGSFSIKERINRVREFQIDRFKDGFRFNGLMTPREIKKYCRLNPPVQSLLREIIDKFHLSARSYDKLLKVARTIADLNESEFIREEDILEAIQYRILDRKYWEKKFS